MMASAQTTGLLLLKLLGFGLFVFLHASEMRSTYYRKYPGYRIQSCVESHTAVPAMSKCAALCSEKTACVSGSYLKSAGLCCLADRRFYQTGAIFGQDSDAVYFEENNGYASYGPWLMAYRAAAGNGHSIYDSFFNIGTSQDSPFECWTTSTSATCTDHRRSRLLDLWNDKTITPKLVKFSLYKNGTEQVNIIFDGVGSNLTAWFSPSRIISSTYTDVLRNGTYLIFSQGGYVDSRATRRFYTAKLHHGCDDDWGWTAIVEQSTCSWESLGTGPLFLYSPTSGVYHWDPSGVGTGRADVMAVFVQL